MCRSNSGALALALATALWAPAAAPAGLAGATQELRGARAQLHATARPLRAERRLPEAGTRRLRGTAYPLTVPFAFARARLAPAARTRLGGLARVLAIRRETRITVDGHTDAIGRTAFNERLSLRRARRVCRTLRRGGVRRCATRAFGERAPVAPNSAGGRDDPRGRARNRRAQIVLRW